MATHPRIEERHDVMMGKPVIRGTRVPVEPLLRKIAEGASEADLLDAYPHLEADDFRAAAAFAADLVAHEQTIVISERTEPALSE